MKSLALENRVVASAKRSARAGWGEKLNAYVEVNLAADHDEMIVLTAAAGYCLGTTGGFDFSKLFHALTGIALLSSGVCGGPKSIC
ncbi:MAG: hypothetical protein WKF84_29595 [Pyrinomonadaceae bacterium]